MKSAEVVRAILSLTLLVGTCLPAFGQGQQAEPSEFKDSGRGVTLRVTRLFEGTRNHGKVPLKAEIRNDGADLVGLLEVAGEQKFSIPVEVPRGTVKEWIFNARRLYNPLQVRLRSNTAQLLVDMYPTFGQTDGVDFLVVSDNIGGMSWVETRASRESERQVESMNAHHYVRPESVPVRPSMLRDVYVIVLGEGSERLSDSQIRAIKLRVLSGGILLVPTGASGGVLRDSRWADIMPALAGPSATESEPDRFIRWLGAQSSVAPFSYTILSPLAHAKVDGPPGRIYSVTGAFGLGLVRVWAFDPFAGSLARFPELSRLIHNDSIYLRTARNADEFVVSTQGNRRTDTIDAPPSGSSTSSGIPTTSTSLEQRDMEDPFSLTLPPTYQIAWILGSYVFLVVIVNFTVLLLLKRAELAWITVPVFSLAYAGVLLTYTRGLYQYQLSFTTTGAIVASQGHDEGVFLGTTNLFFPTGGVYDLGLKHVDSIDEFQEGEDYVSASSFAHDGREAAVQLNPIDIGEMIAPRVSARNLSFGVFSYQATLNTAGWLDMQVNDTSVIVRNGSPHDWRNLFLVYRGKEHRRGNLRVGEQFKVPIANFQTAAQQSGARNEALYRDGVLALRVQVVGINPGPAIGQEVTARSNITLYGFTHVPTGRATR